MERSVQSIELKGAAVQGRQFWRGLRLGYPVYWLLMSLAIILSSAMAGWTLPLSPGDRLRILTPSDEDLPEGSRFRISGLYEVSLDGTLQIPFLEPQPAAGLEVDQVEKALAAALIDKGLFKPEFLQLSVRVAQWAPIQVTVAGETYLPGRILLGTASRPTLSDSAGESVRSLDQTVAIAGNYPPERYLTTAIRQAGGIKPTADIRKIRLVRGKKTTEIDLSGVITGQTVTDVPLIAGDQVIVPQLLQPQMELVRPSQLTPSQVTVMVSNMTVPNQPRSGQILEFEYGTRFSQAVVAAGCAGGTRSTNAKRRVALVHTDRLTGKTSVVDRPVERLLKESTQDADNPFLMPQDSVVCYDSTVTNLASVLRLIGDILNPFLLIPRLFR